MNSNGLKQHSINFICENVDKRWSIDMLIPLGSDHWYDCIVLYTNKMAWQTIDWTPICICSVDIYSYLKMQIIGQTKKRAGNNNVPESPEHSSAPDGIKHCLPAIWAAAGAFPRVVFLSLEVLLMPAEHPITHPLCLRAPLHAVVEITQQLDSVQAVREYFANAISKELG